MNCKLLKQYKYDCMNCPNFVCTCNWDDCEEGYCTNTNEEDLEEDDFERTY